VVEKSNDISQQHEAKKRIAFGASIQIGAPLSITRRKGLSTLTALPANQHYQGAPMIARIWHDYTKPEHADACEAMLKPELLPGIGKVKGYQSTYLLRRDLGEEF
jgi:hypothetical protein